MRKTGLTRLFLMIVMAALVLGCGIEWTDPPTPTPVPTATFTATPIPPTKTPLPTDTPSPTPTPLPTQSLSSLVAELQPVAKGGGVPDAAEYVPSRKGVHPIVILARDNEVDEWNSDLPVSWRPVNLGQVELVASIGYREVDLNTTRYRMPGQSGWIPVTRVRIDTVVTLYEAQSGEVIETKVFTGVEPIGFPPSLPGGTQYLFGEKVSHETIQEWLKDFVEK